MYPTTIRSVVLINGSSALVSSGLSVKENQKIHLKVAFESEDSDKDADCSETTVAISWSLASTY
jgi:hypothetical protein